MFYLWSTNRSCQKRIDSADFYPNSQHDIYQTNPQPIPLVKVPCVVPEDVDTT